MEAVPATAPSRTPQLSGGRAAAVVVLVGLAIRLRGLGEYWLNPDEGIYYSTLTRASFRDFWAEVMANAHPPAFYLLLRAAGAFTWDFVWLRGVVLLFGTAAIWVIWLVGRELGGKGSAGTVGALVAAGLLAVNGEAIVLSQVLRPYMMLLTLLGLALLSLLRYRSEPTTRHLVAYTTFACSSLVTHYSAALALPVFYTLVLYYRAHGDVERRAWWRLALVQGIPAAVLGILYVQHLGSALGSELVGAALDSGGWLSSWLVHSPAAAWHSYVTFQIFHLTPGLRLPAALILLVAIAVSAFSGDRTVAVLAAAALGIALLASALGLYPFGPSRHDTWLVLFTLPALGWLVGHLIDRGRTVALSASGAGAVLLLAGGFAGRSLGAEPMRTNASEERVIRRRELAPLVVQWLAPEGEPRVILMSEQTYNVMMPLYAGEREDVTSSADSTLFSFPYGSRTVVVARQWDWQGTGDVRRVLQAVSEGLPGVVEDARPTTFLLTAGGWGSNLFPRLRPLQENGAVLEGGYASSDAVEGLPTLRVVALVVDWHGLTDSS